MHLRTERVDAKRLPVFYNGLLHLAQAREPVAQAVMNQRMIRLGRDARCHDNWNRYVAAGHGKAEVDHLPVKMDVENVSRCNFRCTMCAVSKWTKGQRARDMTLAEFKALIDEQYGLVEIKLNGLGEAMMQGDDWFAMIAYARSKNIWVRVTTNASLLHLRNNANKLLDSGVNEIDISIDGADAATFQGIRVQSDFERVKSNCSVLNELCARRGIVRTKAWTLVQRANRINLPAHVRLAERLGFKHMVFSTQLHGWADKDLEKRNAAEHATVNAWEANELVQIGRQLGVRVAFWDVANKFTLEKPCPWPFSRAVVTSDSRTVPCCMIGDPDQFEIGKGKTFAENWSGVEYAQFRQGHITGNLPEVCKACYKKEER